MLHSRETVFSNDYDIDTSYLRPKGRRTNNYHVYDMFGRLAGMDGVETKKCMIREIESQRKFYQAKGNVVLSMLRLTIEDWIAMYKHKRIRADELCIFALSVLFNRHTVIFTASKPWSTLDPTGHEHRQNFLSLCDFHLLNLGDNMFINLIPHEEECVFSTLPPGTTMSIFQTETSSETQFEFHYEITPPVPDNEHNDTSDKEDCEVIDYFPHHTARTNSRNKQLVDVIDGYLTPYMKRLSQEQDNSSPSIMNQMDDESVSPTSPLDGKPPDILSNNTLQPSCSLNEELCDPQNELQGSGNPVVKSSNNVDTVIL